MTEKNNEMLFLHGFSSSPRVTMGQRLKEHLAAKGVNLLIPDLNVPSFEKLSPYAIIELVIKELRSSPTVCIANSFGGFISLKALTKMESENLPLPERLILLAPIIDPWHPEYRRLPTEVVTLWKEKGTLPFFHKEADKEIGMDVRFLYELEELGSCKKAPSLPILLIHGSNDTIAPIAACKDFASNNRNVDFKEVEADHDLLKNSAEVYDLIDLAIGI